MTLTGEVTKPKMEVKLGETEYPSKVTYENNWIAFSFEDKDANEVYRGTALIPSTGNIISGRLVLPNGLETSFTANKTGEAKKEDANKKNGKEEKPEVMPLTYPNVGYGFSTLLFPRHSSLTPFPLDVTNEIPMLKTKHVSPKTSPQK